MWTEPSIPTGNGPKEITNNNNNYQHEIDIALSACSVSMSFDEKS